MAPTKVTFGSMPKTVPPGYFKAVNFPVLAMMDTTTGDHRRLAATGAGNRELPVSIRYQPAATYGHDGALPSGALFEVTFDPATRKASHVKIVATRRLYPACEPKVPIYPVTSPSR